MMGGFYSRDKLEEYEIFSRKFYENLNDLDSKLSYKYLKSFFMSMLPTIKIKDEDIVKLLVLKNKVPDSN
jgi:hypothetical protein